MSRIMAIDYGTKRCGIAVTDPLRIVPGGLTVVPTDGLLPFLEKYLIEEEVGVIVIGEPLHADGNPAQIHHLVIGLQRKLKNLYPAIEIALQDERFTSEEAKEVIRMSGVGRKKRRDKALVDKVSAVIILKDYLESR